MNKYNDQEIASNDELERLIQPYSINKLEHLKQELIRCPEKRVVRIWNGCHLDDKGIYEICKMCNLDVTVHELHYKDINEAAIYICKRQLKRRDLAAEYKKYLIGQRYYYEQVIKSDLKSNDSKFAIASGIASELFISIGTVQKYYLYALAMNMIFDQDMIFAKKILSGKIRISHENIIELSRLKPEEIRTIGKSSAEEKIEHITLPYIRNEVKWSHVQVRKPVSRRERSEETTMNRVTIRQMPQYDPDAEVNSLCMTIDSWISSILRVNSSDNFPKITQAASLKLLKKLSVLEHTVNMVQESLVERTKG
jgi:hypothetical protein